VVGFGELLIVEALLFVEYCQGFWIQYPNRDVRKRREKGSRLDLLVVPGNGIDPVQGFGSKLARNAAQKSRAPSLAEALGENAESLQLACHAVEVQRPIGRCGDNDSFPLRTLGYLLQFRDDRADGGLIALGRRDTVHLSRRERHVDAFAGRVYFRYRTVQTV